MKKRDAYSFKTFSTTTRVRIIHQNQSHQNTIYIDPSNRTLLKSHLKWFRYKGHYTARRRISNPPGVYVDPYLTKIASEFANKISKKAVHWDTVVGIKVHSKSMDLTRDRNHPHLLALIKTHDFILFLIFPASLCASLAHSCGHCVRTVHARLIEITIGYVSSASGLKIKEEKKNACMETCFYNSHSICFVIRDF